MFYTDIIIIIVIYQQKFIIHLLQDNQQWVK